MKSSLSLNKFVLLITTMLFAPSMAVAQTIDRAPPASNEQAPAEDAAYADEFVVLGRNIPQPMRETSEVVTVLTVEDLARSGDDNAALALTRLSGLSIMSNRFVYVRGLGDRYSSALLNGSPLPSPEPLRRQVPLDLFPSNILDGASVQKTFSPNYPGEFGGGIIDLRTLRQPTEPFLTLKIGTGGNTEAWGARQLTYRGEQSDWSGISDGLRELPDLVQAAIGSGQLINSSNFSESELEALGESFVNSPLTVIQREDFQPDFEGEVTAGSSYDFGEYNLGLVGVVGYDSAMRTQRATRQVARQNIGSDAISTSTTWDIVFNMFGGASVGWGDNEVSLTGLLVRSTSKEAQIDAVAFDANAPGLSLRTESTGWYERQLASVQLAGEHRFGALELDWRGAFAQSTREAPYERSISYDITPLFPVGYYSGRSLANANRFSDLTDEVISGGVDGAYTIALSPQRDAVISAGITHSGTNRDYALRSFAFLDPFPDLIPDSVRINRPDYLFQPDTINAAQFVLSERTGPDDAYKGRLIVDAAYVAATVDVLPLVQAAAGVRFEDASQTVRTGNTFGATPFFGRVTLENQYFLPAATLTWNFAEDMQVRLGYSQTIARPQFRELAFSPFIDPENDRTYLGNPFLTDSEFQNYDARFEYYFGRDQFVTVGGFYKFVDSPIEEVILPIGDSGYFTQYTNAPEATIYGLEAEFRTRFEMPFDVPGLTGDEWLFAVNYTYTKSEVPGGTDQVVNPGALQPGVTREDTLVDADDLGFDGSALQGSPENIINVQFGYETDLSQITLLVGWVDERIAQRGLGIPSIIEEPGVNLDLVFRRDFSVGGAVVTFGLSGRNLLDEQHREYQLAGNGTEAEVNTYDRGRSYSASLTTKF